MSDFKREFIKDFFSDYPDKEVLRDFIKNKLPLSSADKKFLIMKYCAEKITPNKVMAYNLSISERYVIELHHNIITKSLPHINLIFIKALSTSLKHHD